MAIATQNPSPTTAINWEQFWKRFALVAGIIVGIASFLGVLFGYALHVSEQIGDLKDRDGKLEGQVQILLQEKQNTSQVCITQTPTK